MNFDYIISWSIDRAAIFVFGMILTFVISIFRPIEFSYISKRWNRKLFHKSEVKIEYSFSTHFKMHLSNREYQDWILQIKKNRNFSFKSQTGILFTLSLTKAPNILFEFFGFESESGQEIEGGRIGASYVGVHKDIKKQITEMHSTGLTLLNQLNDIEPARLTYSDGYVVVNLDRAPMGQFFIDQFEIQETKATSKKNYSIDIEPRSLRFSGNLNDADIIEEIARVSNLA